MESYFATVNGLRPIYKKGTAFSHRSLLLREERMNFSYDRGGRDECLRNCHAGREPAASLEFIAVTIRAVGLLYMRRSFACSPPAFLRRQLLRYNRQDCRLNRNPVLLAIPYFATPLSVSITVKSPNRKRRPRRQSKFLSKFFLFPFRLIYSYDS